MGTATFDICQSGSFNKNVRGAYVTGGAHTTTSGVTSMTDGAAGAGSAIEAEVGHVLSVLTDADCRVLFGGQTPTVNVGIFVPADTWQNIEISHPGAIKIIELS